MKTLGVQQFQQKRFKLLELEGEFKPILGNIPKAFQIIIYGESGNGKTEFCIKLAKALTKFGTVAWLSYEQGHGFDLQTAINRNKMEEVSGKFYIIDPVANLKPNQTFLEDLNNYLKRRNSPDFVFIDSLDYTRFDWEDYVFLKDKYGKKKTFVWISHARAGKPLKRIGEQIEYDGGVGVYISKFIATPKKNRFGGVEDYIIYEQRARELNPVYFDKLLKKADKPKEKTQKPAQTTLFEQSEGTEEGAEMHVAPAETTGVDA